MIRPFIIHRAVLALVCLVVVSACATDDEAADEVTEVVTERIVVTEQETVVETETQVVLWIIDLTRELTTRRAY